MIIFVNQVQLEFAFSVIPPHGPQVDLPADPILDGQVEVAVTFGRLKTVAVVVFVRDHVLGEANGRARRLCECVGLDRQNDDCETDPARESFRIAFPFIGHDELLV